MLLVILNRIHAVEWKGRVETREHGRLAHLSHLRRHLVGEQVAAQSRLCPLCILELDNRCVLYRLFSDAEHACRNLSNHVVPVGHNLIRISSLTGRSVGLEFSGSSGPSNHEVETDRPEGHSPAIDRYRDLDSPTLRSLVQ